MKKAKPILDDSIGQNSGGARIFFGLFGLIFFSVGVAAFYAAAFKPYLQKQRSVDWPTAQCQVVKAMIETHDDDDSTSYSVMFSYTFEVDGQGYSGTRYSFANEIGSIKEAKRQLRAFPAGSKRQCCYNPNEPSDCVLDRTNQDQGWMMFFLPFLFIGIGGTVLVFALFGSSGGGGESISGAIDSKQLAKIGRPASDRTTSDGVLATRSSDLKGSADNLADRLDGQWSKPLKLKPTRSRIGRAIGVGFAALFWNGILSVFFFAGGGILNFGWFQIGIVLFFIPFVVIGVLMILGTFYSMLAIFTPTVEIALASGAVPLGGEVDIAWQVNGRSERIKKLKINVLASQFATYQRGTDKTTDVQVFEELLVTESTEITDITFGNAAVTIPADSMHTFDAKHNKIKWQIWVHGVIPWAPDIHEQFEFRVTPTKTQSRSS